MTINTGFKLSNYKSFGPTGAGFKSIKPVNVIVGRNNIGKSALLHALDFLCIEQTNTSNINNCIEITQPLSENQLRRVFPENTSRGDLGGNFWHDHGINFVSTLATWKEVSKEKIELISIEAAATEAETRYLAQIQLTPELRSFKHIKLDADRDISPEIITPEIYLSSSGAGATQIIHKYLQHVEFDRSYIQEKLLTALNVVFAPDIEFNEITTRFHSTTNKWEIFLGEKTKGPLPFQPPAADLKR